MSSHKAATFEQHDVVGLAPGALDNKAFKVAGGYADKVCVTVWVNASDIEQRYNYATNCWESINNAIKH